MIDSAQPYLDKSLEWTPTYGFVWGCVWGDDSSWKVQYLDLSRVQEGIIVRQERFDYVELGTDGYTSAVFDAHARFPARRRHSLT